MFSDRYLYVNIYKNIDMGVCLPSCVKERNTWNEKSLQL